MMNGSSSGLGTLAEEPTDGDGDGNGKKEFTETGVSYVVNPNTTSSTFPQYEPRVYVSRTYERIGRAKVEKTDRPFETGDISRVLDFEDVKEPPPDGPMMHCEDVGKDGQENLTFPSRHCCLRGSFLFYFDLSDVSGTGKTKYITYHGPPLGVIPLDNCIIDYPPGGRRVFREHAHTNARSGYELVILHSPPRDSDDELRPPAFLVAESLGLREKWAMALRERAGIQQSTTLRAAAYTFGGSSGQDEGAEELTMEVGNTSFGGGSVGTATTATGRTGTTSSANGTSKLGIDDKSSKKGARVAAVPNTGENGKGRRGLMSMKSRPSKRNVMKTTKKDSKREGATDEGAIIKKALHEFGKSNFSEKTWIDNYFETHIDSDAEDRCRQMELWQEAIKKGLKGAVLEQYEYFVEASGEMTTMGREVLALKNLVETQVETIKEMKEIDFSSALFDDADDDDDDNDGSDGDNDAGLLDQAKIRKARRRIGRIGEEEDDVSSVSSYGDRSSRKNRSRGSSSRAKFRDASSTEGSIEIPSWFDDSPEEILAYVKESRYTDATEHWTKTKQEISDILRVHEQPMDNLLTKKQYYQLQSLLKNLDEMAELISGRLVESLRRKNEALKQAFKRERSDPLSQMAPSVSPCCLNDDAIPLRLLVKLGKTQEAATAYTARRSLLLMESLHERPISGTGSVDLVIYAAQLSQSFFSCLAEAVEGFMDLFLSALQPQHSPSMLNKEDASLDESSINSHQQTIRNLPAGALAAIVLWCDSELTKFGVAFGGSRVLGNLSLAPPPRESPRRKGPRIVGQSSEEMNGNRERENAIEVAAQCVSQAFQYAAENLDAVGLPLTPRLAECIRSRLKGCEAEVAALLDDTWRHTVVEWEIDLDDSLSIDDRRGG